MESNHRYYARRAVEEATAAARSVTPQARERHKELAEGFRRQAEACSRVAQSA